MIRRWRLGLMLFLLVLGLTAGLATAETIELVTYYPAPSTPDIHTRSLTVGTPYANEVLLDGQAIIYSWLGIGPGFTAGNRPTEVVPAVPTEPLEVAGNILSRAPTAQDSLFISDRAAANRLSGLRLRTGDLAQWTIGSRNDATENLHIYSDAGPTPATRLFIEQATGRIGIGTTSPLARLHAGIDISDYSSYSFTNTGAVITSLGVDQAAARSNVLTLMRDGTSGVVYAGAVAFDLSRFSADSVNARTQMDIRLANTDTATLTDVLSLRSNGNVGIGITNPTGSNSPAGGSTPNTGNLDVNDVWLRGANRWASQINIGPTFINPVEIIPRQAATTVGWTTVNVRSFYPSLPPGTRAIIVSTHLDFSAFGEVHFYVRQNSSSPEQRICIVTATANQGQIYQGIIPLAADGRFEYRVVISASGNSLYSVVLQAYFG